MTAESIKTLILIKAVNFPSKLFYFLNFQKMALRGVRVLELAGLAPAPFCGMILSGRKIVTVKSDLLVFGTMPV